MKKFNGNPGNWLVGRNGRCVVSDQMPDRLRYTTEDYKNEAEYYGGYLIAESIPTEEDAHLIAASKRLLEKAMSLYDMFEKMNGEPVDVMEQAAAMSELSSMFNDILNFNNSTQQ